MTRGIALFLTVLTGFSGLVYEVAWQRYLATLLGSHSEATAAVLAIFLGGLAVGYSVFGSVTARLMARSAVSGRPPRLTLLYGVVEAAIGIYVILFPVLFSIAQWLSYRMPADHAGLGFAFDVALSALLIGPPTILMGGTIPVLTQALSRGLADATRLHAWVYGFNTAGAFAGALAGALWLIPELGLVGVLVSMGVVNLVAGGVFIAIGLKAEPAPATTDATASPGQKIEGFSTYALVAILSGFAMMSIQTILIRVSGLSFGSSQFTFAMIVAAFVLCIAVGSLLVSTLTTIHPWTIVVTQWALIGLLIALYTQLQDAPYWAHVLRSLFRDSTEAFVVFELASFLMMLAAIGLPVLLSGATLPLLFHHLRRQMGDLGAVAGRLYSWNTVGSLLGALLGGYVLLFWFDLDVVFRISVAALILAAVLLTVQLIQGRMRLVSVGLLTVAALSLVVLPRWSVDRLSSGLFRQRHPLHRSYQGPDAFFAHAGGLRTLYYRDGPTGSVAVKETRHDRGDRSRALFVNGKPDSDSVLDYPTMALAALIPALLVEKPERAFVIGYGTGATVNELAALRSIREVEVAEISRNVIEAAPLFDPWGKSLVKNRKVNIQIADAYRALLRSSGNFDVITSEPSNPWVTGVEMLFSREFLEAARSRLAPGGVYAQWIHTYEIDDATLELVLRTYVAVFDQAAVWYTMQGDLLLLGFGDDDVEIDVDRMAARASQIDYMLALAKLGITSFPQLLAHELLPIGVLHSLRDDRPVHTLLHPILSHRAARAFFRGDGAELPRLVGLDASRAGAKSSLLRRYAARQGGLGGQERALIVREVCSQLVKECATLVAEWLADEPASPILAQELDTLLANPDLDADLRRALAPESLSRLAQLFASGSVDRPNDVTPTSAAQASQLFTDYYHHAAPFDRHALADLWQRCEAGADPAGCADGRLRIEERMGDLNAPVDAVAAGSKRGAASRSAVSRGG